MTRKQLKKILFYDPETGIFIRLVSCGKTKVGDIAGNMQHGYIRMWIGGRLYKAHRLAFLYMTGKFPADEVDHINHVKDDNRWKNLREATRAINCKNRSLNNNNTSGCAGVYWNKANRKWMARININGEEKYLGLFIEKTEAIETRKAAEIKYDYNPNHGQIGRC